MTESEIDDFLDGIVNDKTSNNSSKANKLAMTARSNKGTVLFVPIASASGKWYTKVYPVREINQFTRLNEKIGEGDCWHRILPKECYKNLSAEDEALYDHVVERFEKLYDSGAWGYDLDRAGVARVRAYVFFYGYVLSHVNEQGQPQSDNVGKPALLYYSTGKVIDALADAIEAKKLASQGNVAWIPRYFNKAAKGHTGALSIKCSGGKGGYNFSISFQSNNEDNPYLVPNDLDLTDAFDKCQDPLNDFLGWQGDAESGYFNHDLFEEMKEYVDGYFLEGTDNIDPKFIQEAPAEESEQKEQPAQADPLKA